MRMWSTIGLVSALVACGRSSDVSETTGGEDFANGGELAPAPGETDSEENAGTSSGTGGNVGAASGSDAVPVDEPVGSADGGAGSSDPEDEPAGPTLPPAADFADAGPFDVDSFRGGPSDAFTLFIPSPLGGNGLRHPVLTWGNGTGATPGAYRALLKHLASHGFVVIASNSTQTGSGDEMLKGVDFLLAENELKGSAFFHTLAADAVGALGHSQGGGGSINAGNDPRISVTCPIQPAPGTLSSLHGPMLILGGGAYSFVSVDRLVRPLVFNRSPVPTILAVLEGASHFEPVGAGGDMRGPITAWFRLHLAGDETARSLFDGKTCGLCTDSRWVVERRNF